MTLMEQILTVLLCALATMTTRFLPFLCFSSASPTPPLVKYLGNALPGAIFGMLIVYCLKDVSFLTGHHGFPEFLGILWTVLLHLKFRQMLISIAGGTIVYMLMVQFLFP